MVDIQTQPNAKELWHNWREVKRVLTQSRSKDGVINRMTKGECDAIIKGKKKLPAKLRKLMVPYGSKRPSVKRPQTKEDAQLSLKEALKVLGITNAKDLAKAFKDE